MESVFDMTHAVDVVRECGRTIPTLQARMGTGGNQVPLVLHEPLVFGLVHGGHIGTESTVAPTLDTTTPTPAKNQGGLMVLNKESTGLRKVVRKLTPVECERLQGFPDDWTKIPYRGKTADKCPDAPRYKAIGNSWAVPCVRWVGARIQREMKGENE